MSAIHTKSLTGITSITTPPGVDNVFTVHSNDTTERFRVDLNGNQSIAGILTVSQDLDVDGHTNLDNVSVAGVSTFSDNVILAEQKELRLEPSGAFKLYRGPGGGGANNFIKSTFGSINLEAANSFIVKVNNSEDSIAAYANDRVDLYHNNQIKLTTTTKGIQVGTGVTIETNGQATYTGIVTASSFKLSDGSSVGGVESDAQYNTVAGTNAGDAITSDGTNNTAFGYNAITDVTEGDDNTAVGFEAGLQANASTFKNTFIGSRAGRNVTTGTRNTYIGYDAGRSTSNKSTSTCIGYNAGLQHDGSDVVCIGSGAGQYVHGGTTAIGAYSGGNVSGINQVFIGYNCGKDLTGNSSKNTLVGYGQFGSNSGARDNNTGVGYGAAWKCQGDNNTFVGTETLENALGAANNSVFGYKAGDLITTGDNNIVIGANADPSSATVSNEITLGDANITKFRIPGCGGFNIDTTGHVLPGSNNASNLGSSSYRWANVYVNDLQLSNEAKKDEGGNDVDGTWGDWTLQEGEHKIYMINNRTGKKYSLKMEEE